MRHSAYAAFTHFAQSNQEDSIMVPQPFVGAELQASLLAGNIAPRDTKSMTAIMTNPGTVDGVAFIRFSCPTISSAFGIAGSAYTWEVNSSWTVVEGNGYTVYGYDSPIGADDSTGNQMDSIKMKNMSAANFRALGDNVNVHLLGFVAE